MSTHDDGVRPSLLFHIVITELGVTRPLTSIQSCKVRIVVDAIPLDGVYPQLSSMYIIVSADKG
jgi:hypothetical protein